MKSVNVSIRNDIGEFDELTPVVTSFLETSNVPRASAYAVHLVIEELVSNIIRHAFDDDASHDIDVGLEREQAGIRVTIADDGKPFDPRSVPAPDLPDAIEKRKTGGLGLHLVRTMTRDFSYTREDDRNIVSCRVDFRDGAA